LEKHASPASNQGSDIDDEQTEEEHAKDKHLRAILQQQLDQRKRHQANRPPPPPMPPPKQPVVKKPTALFEYAKQEPPVMNTALPPPQPEPAAATARAPVGGDRVAYAGSAVQTMQADLVLSQASAAASVERRLHVGRLDRAAAAAPEEGYWVQCEAPAAQPEDWYYFHSVTQQVVWKQPQQFVTMASLIDVTKAAAVKVQGRWRVKVAQRQLCAGRLERVAAAQTRHAQAGVAQLPAAAAHRVAAVVEPTVQRAATGTVPEALHFVLQNSTQLMKILKARDVDSTGLLPRSVFDSVLRTLSLSVSSESVSKLAVMFAGTPPESAGDESSVNYVGFFSKLAAPGGIAGMTVFRKPPPLAGANGPPSSGARVREPKQPEAEVPAAIERKLMESEVRSLKAELEATRAKQEIAELRAALAGMESARSDSESARAGLVSHVMAVSKGVEHSLVAPRAAAVPATGATRAQTQMTQIDDELQQAQLRVNALSAAKVAMAVQSMQTTIAAGSEDRSRSSRAAVRPPGDPPAVKPNRPFECAVCRRTFREAFHLGMHAKNHE